jgi:anti-sigma B factor antagonist
MPIAIFKSGEAAVLRLDLKGRLDYDGARALRAELDNLLDGRVRSLRIDFSQVDFVSSAGLRVLLFCRRRMKNYGEFLVFNPSEFVSEILYNCGLTRILDIVKENTEEADGV